MDWHSEVSTLVLRGYVEDADASFARRDPFMAVAYCKLIGPDAWIEGALRTDGRPLSYSDWAGLARLLRERHSVEVIRGEHKGQPLAIETRRAR